MSTGDSTGLDRRRFLKVAGTAAVVGFAHASAVRAAHIAQIPDRPVAYVRVGDAAATSEVVHAIEVLATALKSKGIQVIEIQPGQQLSAPPRLLISIIASSSPAGRAALGKIVIPEKPEALAVFSKSDLGAPPEIVAAGHDPRGIIYAVLELADRVQLAPDAATAFAMLKIPLPIIETPANRVRGIFRMFVSEVEDKAWFHDRVFWREYLSMLVAQRFNRFNLSLGLGYDNSNNIHDAYFFFAYPFLVKVPGYDVRAIDQRTKAALPDVEREKNLESLRFISNEAAGRGLQFQLGIWTHSYRWNNSPDANFIIEGLTPETQALYSRDALRLILRECPGIHGITLRTHGESGVPEGSYDLWKIIMSGITGLTHADGSARVVELDMHGKSMTQQMIDTALTTNMPVTISPKFWAEHMGLPYMQASIRPQEMPKAQDAGGLMGLSRGTRSFLRYSYGDLIQTDRKYSIVHRVWPGTQRLLLWGDPLYAAEYGRIFHFCGTDGVDYFEPLSFKGRQGSGVDESPAGGQRGGYADKTLRPEGGDWRKYLYTYRLLGRLSYNPDSDPEVWRRFLKTEYGPDFSLMETALANASRILPMITSAHDPSGANNHYWPEMYVNMSLFDATKVGSYGEAPTPKIFSNVTSLDPQLFTSIRENVTLLVQGMSTSKVTPQQVADQLDAWSEAAFAALAQAQALARDKSNPAFRRAYIDASITAGIGRFFASKLRAALCFTLFDLSGLEAARNSAVQHYKRSRDAWAALSNIANAAYVADLTFGPERHLRRTWQDRLADIDADIQGIATLPASIRGSDIESFSHSLRAVNIPSSLTALVIPQHTPPVTFHPGKPIPLSFANPRGSAIHGAKLWYRQVNQGEAYRSVELTPSALGAELTHVEIPAEAAAGLYPLQYYFEFTSNDSKYRPTRHPDFTAHFAGQPYFIVMPV